MVLIENTPASEFLIVADQCGVFALIKRLPNIVPADRFGRHAPQLPLMTRLCAHYVQEVTADGLPGQVFKNKLGTARHEDGTLRSYFAPNTSVVSLPVARKLIGYPPSSVHFQTATHNLSALEPKLYAYVAYSNDFFLALLPHVPRSRLRLWVEATDAVNPWEVAC